MLGEIAPFYRWLRSCSYCELFRTARAAGGDLTENLDLALKLQRVALSLASDDFRAWAVEEVACLAALPDVATLMSHYNQLLYRGPQCKRPHHGVARCSARYDGYWDAALAAGAVDLYLGSDGPYTAPRMEQSGFFALRTEVHPTILEPMPPALREKTAALVALAIVAGAA